MAAELELEPRSIGETLYLLRRRTRLDREELAERAGVVHATYSRYENDTTRNGVYDVAALRRILHVLADELHIDDRVLWDAVFTALERREIEERVRFDIQAEVAGINKRGRRGVPR